MINTKKSRKQLEKENNGLKIVTFVLIIIFLTFNCQEKTNDADTINRSIALEGQPNFRDIGAYETGSGEHIKTDILYRSGTLSRLTDSDVEKLKSLNIKTVVNFLTEEERNKNGEDILPEGVKSIYLPISGQNNEAVAILKARENGDFSDVPSDFNFKIHGILVEDAKAEYAELFHILADKESYKIVFHCSHGIHRTGTAASIILSILGVPWEKVREDYLLSNEYRKEEIEKRIAALTSLARENPDISDQEKNLENIEAFYVLKGEYVDGTKTTIENNYESFEHYLQDIGVQEMEIEKIKDILIE